ncbi:RHS repeat-associated core domain-containing protein [Paraburkholderia terrae]
MTLLAVTHLAPVVGIDVHEVTIPPSPVPVPVPHPHVGFVLDLQEYLSAAKAVIGSIVFSFVEEQTEAFLEKHQAEIENIANSDFVKAATGAVNDVMNNSVVKAGMGAMHAVNQLSQNVTDALGGNIGNGGGGRPIFINGLMRATAGTHTYHVPGLHFPLGAGFADTDATGPSQDSESFMGSRTVLANNDPLSFLALPALSCWFVGMEPMGHNSAHTDRKYPSLPTSVMLPIPAGNPVLVGGPPVMNMMAVAAALFKAFRGSKLAKKLFGKFPSGFIKCVIFDAEPVNSITGEVVVQQNDFTIDGRLPLTWDRYYASHDTFVGVLGRGWQSPADIRVELVRDGEQFGAAVYFPDHATAFDELPAAPGWEERRYDRQHGHALYIQDCVLKIRSRTGIEYSFALPDHWRDAVPAPGRRAPLGVKLAQLSDLHGNAWQIVRDAQSWQGGPVLQFVEWSANAPTGRVVQCLAGDVQGGIGRVVLRDAQGGSHPLVRYRQDRSGALVSVLDALDVPYSFEYGDAQQMVRHTDRNGLSFYYRHRVHDDGVWRVERAWGDGGLYDYHFAYDPEHLETRFTDSLGHVTVLQYNDQQWPVARIDGLGGVCTYQYDGQGRTSAEVDPAGNTTRWEYDEYGNLLAHTLPDRSVVRTRYDSDHRPVAIADPEGGVWSQTWDGRGNLLTQLTPSGIATAFGYDARGQMVQVADAAGQVTTLSYDALGNLASLTDALGRTTGFSHDARGNLIWREAPGEEPTVYKWDAKDRLVACGLPGGRDVRCEYDAEDNLIRYQDESGQTTAFGYYGQGQLASRTDPDGSVTRYHYDTEEQLTGVTNPLGVTWHLKRDATGRLTEEIDYYGQSRRYAYDPAGHLIRTTDPLGHALSVACDAMGRITRRRVEREGGQEEQYAYNRRGQLTEARNACSTVRRMYDVDGRLTTETQQQPQTVGTLEYAYDAAGRLQTQRRELKHLADEVCSQQTVTYGYDAAGQVQSVQIDAQEPMRFTHDMAGRLSHTHFSAALGHRYEYDRAGRLSRHVTVRTDHHDEQTGYAYDASGNLVARTDSRLGEDGYRYDPLGRIVAHTDPAGRLRHFVHDLHGDRFRAHADGQGRVLRHEDGELWRMDVAGQLVERQSRTAGVQRLEWDEFGRLACFENTHNECWRYQYDALGRRVGKAAAEVRRQVEGVRHGKHGARTWFLWDGDVFAGELRREPDQAGVATDAGRFYVYHPDSFEPLAMQVVEQSCDTGVAAAEVGLYYYQNDPNGAPVRLRTGDGRIVWEAHYGVTGKVDHVKTCLIDQPVRLQGQYHDEESNLHYNRHRYYDPNTGYFISQDPIGLEGGLNPYEFAPNVFGWIDPWGLKGIPNPWGRRGSPAHRSKIQDAENRLSKSGWTTISGGSLPEQKRGSRYPDLEMEKNGQKMVVQVGRKTKGSKCAKPQPISRERAAIKDLRALNTYSHVFFVSY